MRPLRLALYTTAYPGCERYLNDWYRSVRNQLDSDFDVFVGADRLDAKDIAAAIDWDIGSIQVFSFRNLTPADIRSGILEILADRYWGVVLASCDDVLMPTRIGAARLLLASHDLVGCALRIIDRYGQDQGVQFAPDHCQDPVKTLPYYNVFGFNNSAYRAELLQRCLPLPSDSPIPDWLLATRAWAMGARICFDRVERGGYRQCGYASPSNVIGTFSAEDVLSVTRLVLEHYRTVLHTRRLLPARIQVCVRRAAARALDFYRSMLRNEAQLDEYVRFLNALPRQYVWWWCVAHPALEHIWKPAVCPDQGLENAVSESTCPTLTR